MDDKDLEYELRFALFRLEQVERIIGDPQHPRHRNRTGDDLAYQILAVIDPPYDTNKEIDNDPVMRAITRYEEKANEKAEHLQKELDKANLKITELLSDKD